MDLAGEIEQRLLSPRRLAVVQAVQMLDTPAEETFDAVTRLACALLSAPSSFLSILDAERDFYKSQMGFPEELAAERQLGGRTFCHHTLARTDALVIEDTHANAEWAAVPTVQSLGVRAYIGVPLTVEGQAIGSLCVIDARPRAWTPLEIETLTQLAKSAEREVALRMKLRGAQADAARISAIAQAQEQTIAGVAYDLRRQQSLLQRMPGFVAVLAGPQHRHEYVNDAYVEIVGRDVTGRTSREAFPDLQGQGFFELLDRVYASGESYAGRAVPLRLGGETADRFIDLLFAATRDDAGAVNGIFVGGYDVTEHVRRKADLEKAVAELAQANATLEDRVTQALREHAALEDTLRQSQKMEAVGQLTGGLAHDFNNLLAGLLGSLQLARRRLEAGRIPEVGRHLDTAEGAVQRAASLTHRLLAFSRRQTLAPEAVELHGLVSGMEELLRRTIGPQVGLEVMPAAGLWSIHADRGQLENALLNLCLNARDAMPEGGTITITMANQWIDEQDASRRDLVPGPYVSLGVADTGTGMPPEILQRAFEPFYTTKPIGVGTGLGLSMVYGFARQSGGQVRIESQPGRGTLVCIELPRGEAGGGEQPAQATATAASPVEPGATVLVIDDEPDIRELIVEVLKELGYGTLQAGNGTEALEILRGGARIDLLITDVGLPGGMNGRQIAEAGRELRPALPVLFLTGYAEHAVLGRGDLAAGMHVMTKPFDIEALGLRVQNLIEH